MGTRRKLSIVVDAEYEGKREIQQAGRDVDDLGRASKSSSFDMEGLAKTGAAVGVALGAVAVAGAAAYKAIGEGADLIAAEQKFGNLAESIDTTADSLLGKMTVATNGMVSQAELISAGTDIMNLGLAKSEDGVVRLASAVGALDLDMGVLALTLANDSTARLDSLGLSMEDVIAKKKELIESGFIGDAFDEAVLISLEEKMVLLGDASKTTAGQMAIVEAAMADLNNEGKMLSATVAGPLIVGLANAVTGQNRLNDGIAAGVITTKEWNEIVNEAANIQEGTADAIDYVNRKIEEQETGISAAEKTIISYYEGMAEGTSTAVAGFETYQNAMAGAQLQQEAFNESQAAGRQALVDAQESYTTITGFIGGLNDNAGNAAEKMRDLALSTMEASNAAAVAAGTMTPLEAAIANISSKEGLGIITEDEASRLRDAAVEFENFNEIVQNNVQAFSDAGMSAQEQGDIIAQKLELIGTTSLTTEENMRLMAVQGAENTTALTSEFSLMGEEVDTAAISVGALKDLIIDGLPDEKIVKIIVDIEQRGGSVQQIAGSVGSTNSSATTTAVSNDIGR